EEDVKYESYCKHCGANLPKGQTICHVCGNKVD
ncbi:MAG: zinc-ribbon domain-containing protein, partial [Promethearchaeota archaeon]